MTIEFEDIDQESENKKAYLYALKLLTRKDYSKHKLSKKLQDQKFSTESITKTIAELIRLKYLQEELYAAARTRGFMYKGYSETYILQKLSQENVHVELSFISNIFEEYNFSTYSQLEYLLHKKLRSKSPTELEDFNFRKKLLRYFISKGHTITDGIAVLNKNLKVATDEDKDFYE